MTLWKDIVGYEGIYAVSDTGFVKSFRREVRRGNHMLTVPERILKPMVCKQPGTSYAYVALHKEGKRHVTSVHRLVAEAFLGSAPTPKHEVDHEDGDGLHNHVRNLRWKTRANNQRNRHSTRGRTGITGVYPARSKRNPFRVQGRNNTGAYIYVGCFPTLESAAAAYEAFKREMSK